MRNDHQNLDVIWTLSPEARRDIQRNPGKESRIESRMEFSAILDIPIQSPAHRGPRSWLDSGELLRLRFVHVTFWGYVLYLVWWDMGIWWSVNYKWFWPLAFYFTKQWSVLWSCNQACLLVAKGDSYKCITLLKAREGCKFPRGLVD